MTAGPESYAVRAHVDAWQVTTENLIEVARWCSGDIDAPNTIDFEGSREVAHTAEVGDWVVRGTTGEFFALEDRWFREHYYREDRPEPVVRGCLTGEPLRITRREVRS